MHETLTCSTCATPSTDEVLHPVYLPLTRSELRSHFASVTGTNTGCQDKYLHHYLDSLQANKGHQHAWTSACSSTSHQVEKDERFWAVAALAAAYRSPDRVAFLSAVLKDALGQRPPFHAATWAEALGPADDLELYFEVNMPAPGPYLEHQQKHALAHAVIPKQRQAALAGVRAEGTTKVDAVLVSRSTHVAVLFEAKVLSDTSVQTTHDAARNQLARNIDVMLEPHPGLAQRSLAQRDPDKTCLVLLTPELFRQDPYSRLYGTLLSAYRSDLSVLKQHLPHRELGQLVGVQQRLGWTSWEALAKHVPGACAWL